MNRGIAAQHGYKHVRDLIDEFVHSTRRRQVLAVSAVLVTLFLTFVNLGNYPETWFDEGSHLQVPKTLVEHGQYAYRSSEGFRYYGPTIGVGPTVMLPVAGMFKLFGVGLIQARVVVAVYTIIAIALFFIVAGRLGGRRVGVIATALLVTSRGIDLIEYGRQLLGEVPGLCFLLAGLLVWFLSWDKPTLTRMILAGVLMGLASITKFQYFLVVAPTLLISWVLNLIYYRASAQRVFLVPGILTGVVFGLWILCLVLYLGPTDASENLAALRESVASAATVFDPVLLARSLNELLKHTSFLGALIPAILFGLFLVAPRTRAAQKWSAPYVLILVNFIWYAAASIGWIRYAFLGLALSTLFVARFFSEMTDGFRLTRVEIGRVLREGAGAWPVPLFRLSVLAWLAAMMLVGLGRTTFEIITARRSNPVELSDFLKANVPTDVVVETWEYELGFLSDHNFHFPPQRLLAKAIAYAYLNGPPPAKEYDFVQVHQPEYIVYGNFANWVEIYPHRVLAQYRLINTIGPYKVYQRMPKE